MFWGEVSLLNLLLNEKNIERVAQSHLLLSINIDSATSWKFLMSDSVRKVHFSVYIYIFERVSGKKKKHFLTQPNINVRISKSDSILSVLTLKSRIFFSIASRIRKKNDNWFLTLLTLQKKYSCVIRWLTGIFIYCLRILTLYQKV